MREAKINYQEHIKNSIMLIFAGECHPLTMREFLECNYPELLEAAESGCAVLTELQNALVELLPLSKKMLPSNIGQLADIEAQANFMAFIYHHSLFAFADKAYTMLSTQCTALAEALNSGLEEEEKDAADKLQKTIKALSNIPFENLLEHSAVGLLRLEIFKDYLQERLDFNVIPIFDATGKLRGHWSFRDITGIIVRSGLSHEQLLTDCINAPLPPNTTIEKVVDDETLLRIY
jgi:hypothetical protein